MIDELRQRFILISMSSYSQGQLEKQGVGKMGQKWGKRMEMGTGKRNRKLYKRSCGGRD